MSLDKTGKEKLETMLSGLAELAGAALILFMFWLLMLAGHAMGLS